MHEINRCLCASHLLEAFGHKFGGILPKVLAFALVVDGERKLLRLPCYIPQRHDEGTEREHYDAGRPVQSEGIEVVDETHGQRDSHNRHGNAKRSSVVPAIQLEIWRPGEKYPWSQCRGPISQPLWITLTHNAGEDQAERGQVRAARDVVSEQALIPLFFANDMVQVARTRPYIVQNPQDGLSPFEWNSPSSADSESLSQSQANGIFHQSSTTAEPRSR
ncbi:hypothetical protein VTN31DRAFT_5365 [Thermomyces dupontii]|uniref:uncharacterized protein n=1 Tax=Talaromyces thermophilus TaxID=28565 RepID=UPI0037433E8E